MHILLGSLGMTEQDMSLLTEKDKDFYIKTEVEEILYPHYCNVLLVLELPHANILNARIVYLYLYFHLI